MRKLPILRKLFVKQSKRPATRLEFTRTWIGSETGLQTGGSVNGRDGLPSIIMNVITKRNIPCGNVHRRELSTALTGRWI